MTTLTTPLLMTTLRTQLLTHMGQSSGTTLAGILGITPSGAGSDGKLFWYQAPDNIDTVGGFPYGILALKNRRSLSDIAEGEAADLEVMLFGRPRAQQATVEAAADACEEAMLRFKESADGGLIWVLGKLRQSLPVFTAPADREVVQVMVTFTLRLYTAFTTQYADV